MEARRIELHLLELELFILRKEQGEKRVTKHRKKMWVRKIFKERQEKGEYHILVNDLQLFDAEYFFKTFRMTVAKFEELLAWVGPSIQKSSRLRVDVPSPAERLCVTLRYFTQLTLSATSLSICSLHSAAGIVSSIVCCSCEKCIDITALISYILFPAESTSTLTQFSIFVTFFQSPLSNIQSKSVEPISISISIFFF